MASLGLIHNWKFNGNTLDSVNINSLTGQYDIPGRTGVDLIIQPQQLGVYNPVQLSKDITSVTFEPGQDGKKYLKWDGVNNCAAYAELGQHTNSNGTLSYYGLFSLYRRTIKQNFLITCWVKYDGTTRPGFKFTGPDATKTIELNFNSGTGKFTLNNTDFGGVITTGEWYFVAIMLRPNGNPEVLYASVNGGAETQVAFVSDISSVETYTRLYCYDGLSDLRLYGNTMSGTDIPDNYVQEVYNLGDTSQIPDNIFSGSFSKPRRQYKFNSKPNDSSNPTPYYDPVLHAYRSFDASNTSGDPALFVYADGKIDKAIKVGSDNQITPVRDETKWASLSWPINSGTADYNKDNNAGNFSISFWISVGYSLSTPQTHSENYLELPGPYINIGFDKNVGYALTGYLSAPIHGFVPLSVYPDFDHVAYVYQKRHSRLVIYVNGVPRAQIVKSLTSDFRTIAILGGLNYNDVFGSLSYFDDVRFYDSDITSTDLLSIYSSGYGTESSAIKRSIDFRHQTRVNHAYTKSMIAYLSLSGSVRVNNLISSVLVTSNNKSQLTNSSLVYAIQVSQQFNSLFFNTFNKKFSTGLLKRSTTTLAQSFQMWSSYGADQSASISTWLPHYLYTAQTPKSFSSGIKARYVKPDLSPAIKPVSPNNLTAEINGPAEPSASQRVSSFVPKFPKNALDGMQIIDKYGNKWTYISRYDSWISQGDNSPPAFVSEKNDGIITPDIYSKLRYLSEWQGKIPARFKLAPYADAYYYYFRSSDGLIDFNPEGNDLRLEINKGRLFSILYRQICPGDKGPVGKQGVKGPTGFLAKDELAYVPVFSTFNAAFKVFTIAPLTLDGEIPLPNSHVPDISIRLFDLSNVNINPSSTYYQVNYLNRYFFDEPEMLKEISAFSGYLDKTAMGLQPTSDDGIPASIVYSDTYATIGTEVLAEILVDPTGQIPPRIQVYNAALAINEKATLATIKYDNTNNFTSGSFVFNDPIEPNIYAVRVQQKGPDGVQGDPGSNCISISECNLSGQHIVGTCPVVNVRLDCNSNTFYSHCADLIENLCVQYIQLQGNNNSLNDRDAMDSTFLSVEVSLKANKLVMKYSPKLKDAPQYELNFTNWTPTDECRRSRHYNDHNFNWYTSYTGVCDPGLFSSGPANVLGQLDSAPAADTCCQEPFFYFPSIQDGPCSTDTGSGSGGAGSSSSSSSSFNSSSGGGGIPPTSSSSGGGGGGGGGVSSSSSSSSSAWGGGTTTPYPFPNQIAIGTDIGSFNDSFMSAYYNSINSDNVTLTIIQKATRLLLAGTPVVTKDNWTVATYKYTQAGPPTTVGGQEVDYINIAIKKGEDYSPAVSGNYVQLTPLDDSHAYFKIISVASVKPAATDGIYLTTGGRGGGDFVDSTKAFVKAGTSGHLKFDGTFGNIKTALFMVSSPTVQNLAPMVIYWGDDMNNTLDPKPFPPRPGSSSSSAASFKWANTINVQVPMPANFMNTMGSYYGNVINFNPCIGSHLQDANVFFNENTSYPLIESGYNANIQYAVYGGSVDKTNQRANPVGSVPCSQGTGLKFQYLLVQRNSATNVYTFAAIRDMADNIMNKAFNFDLLIGNRNQRTNIWSGLSTALNVNGRSDWFKDGSAGSTSINSIMNFKLLYLDDRIEYGTTADTVMNISWGGGGSGGGIA